MKKLLLFIALVVASLALQACDIDCNNEKAKPLCGITE